jgi:steroid 5-alpha reductase family enzyme
VSNVLISNLAILLTIMTLLWAVSLWLRDASIVDPFWGVGFVILAWISIFRIESPAPRVMLIAIMTTLWGIRLASFLLFRNRGHGEDKRYAAMRAKHGPRFAWISLFTVFWLQAVILWFVAMPIQVAAFHQIQSPLSWIDAIGVVLWGVGLAFESIGDAQLARFKSKPENSGKVMDKGLWAWTRHPNYFGDFCVWWGIYVVASQGNAAWTILSPILMSWLLMKVSGVSLLERTIEDRRPGYVEYKQRTPAFFPRLPIKSKSS